VSVIVASDKCEARTFSGEVSSIAFDVQELFADVANVDEGSGVFHHLVDVLIRGWNFVEKDFRSTKFDAVHRAFEVGHRKELARLRR
jgi:hypothetical protein